MGFIRIEDFPSETNFKNFQYDMTMSLPGVPMEVDYSNEVVKIALDYYEANRHTITDFALTAGAVVFHEADDS